MHLTDNQDSDDDVIIVRRTEPSGHKRPVPNDPAGSPPAPPAKKKYHRPTSPRRTPRKHTTREIPGKVPDDQLEKLITLTDEEPEIPRRAYGSKSLPNTSKSTGEAPVKVKKPPIITRPSNSAGVQQATATSPQASEDSGAIIFHVSGRKDGKLPRRCSIGKTQLRQIFTKENSMFSSAATHHRETGSKRLRSLEPPQLPAEDESAILNSKTLPEEAGPAFQKPLPRSNTQFQEPQMGESKSPSQEHPKTIPKSAVPHVKDYEEPIPENTTLVSQKTAPQPPAFQRPAPQLQETKLVSPKTKPTPEPTPHNPEPLRGMIAPVSQPLEPLPRKTTPSQTEATREDEPMPPPQKHPRSSPTTNQARNPTSQPQTTSSKPRQKTLIPLWIITREPRSSEELWDEGKFTGTTLAAFLEGISSVTQRDHIEKIKLTLRSPRFDTKITVLKDADDAWALAKETFTEKVREVKAEARAKRQPDQPFKILIEPFYEEGSLASGNMEDEEDDFEF